MLTIKIEPYITEQYIDLKEVETNQEMKLKKDSSGIVVDKYEGLTEITPSSTEVILLTKDKLVEDNVVIHPIPSNYGRIEYNGSTLMVF